MGKLYIIGIDGRGPDSEIIGGASFIAGGQNQLDRLAGIDCSAKEIFRIGSNLENLSERIRAVLPVGDAVVLAGGDPLFFGIGRYLLARFSVEETEVIPAISAIQYAAARLKMPWDDAGFVSIHGRGIDRLLPAALANNKLFILTDPVNTPQKAARHLLDNRFPDCPAHVLESLGTDCENISTAPLSGIAGQNFDSPNIMVIENAGKPEYPVITPGIPDEQYSYRDGMITKAEVRAVVISKLMLAAGSILWDVGAGSGSVSVEAAKLAAAGHVYAIEKTDTIHIEKNRDSFGIKNLTIINGEAPGAFGSIPASPDAIFIGGSGGKLSGIIDSSIKHLKKNGRLVMTFVLPENLTSAQNILKKAGMAYELVTLNISKAADTAPIPAPLTPVYILCARGRETERT